MLCVQVLAAEGGCFTTTCVRFTTTCVLHKYTFLTLCVQVLAAVEVRACAGDVLALVRLHVHEEPAACMHVLAYLVSVLFPAQPPGTLFTSFAGTKVQILPRWRRGCMCLRSRVLCLCSFLDNPPEALNLLA